jgi:hypothetical protein
MAALDISTIEKLIDREDYVSIAPDGTVTIAARGSVKHELEALRIKNDEQLTELNRLRGLLNTPEIEDFDKAVPLEAAHQVKRWGTKQDEGKSPEDWFWLLGYLAGKALSSMKAGDLDKAKHHCISSAAALRNWHAHIRSGQSVMRPGIESPEHAGGAK